MYVMAKGPGISAGLDMMANSNLDSLPLVS